MAKRLELQSKLEQILGSRNVYFQPPESIKLSYPCIIYELSTERDMYADDKVYRENTVYDVTVIDRNPDSLIGKHIKDSFNYCRFARSYSADNLHHFVYELYY